MTVTCAGFGVLYEPVGEVVIVGGLDPGGGVRHRGQRAGVIVGVGYGGAVLVGLRGHPAIAVVGVADEVLVAVGQLLQIAVAVGGVGVAGQGGAADLDAAP